MYGCCLWSFPSFFSFHTPCMATALFVSFDVAHVETLTSVKKRAAVVSYIWKIVAHFALHLTLFFLVLQPWKLLKPFFFKPTADHLPLFFVFVSWCRLLRICSSCLIFSLFSSFVAFLVNFINLFGVSFDNLTSALKTLMFYLLVHM